VAVDEMYPSTNLIVTIQAARDMHHKKPRNNAVVVEVFGFVKDSASERTAVVRAVDQCTWGETFEFPLIVPEMAVVLLTLIRDGKWNDEFIGQTAFTVNNMTKGTTVMPLLLTLG